MDTAKHFVSGEGCARTVVVHWVGQVVPQILQGAFAGHSRLGPEAQIGQHRQPRIAHLQRYTLPS